MPSNLEKSAHDIVDLLANIYSTEEFQDYIKREGQLYKERSEALSSFNLTRRIPRSIFDINAGYKFSDFDFVRLAEQKGLTIPDGVEINIQMVEEQSNDRELGNLPRPESHDKIINMIEKTRPSSSGSKEAPFVDVGGPDDETAPGVSGPSNEDLTVQTEADDTPDTPAESEERVSTPGGRPGGVDTGGAGADERSRGSLPAKGRVLDRDDLTTDVSEDTSRDEDRAEETGDILVAEHGQLVKFEDQFLIAVWGLGPVGGAILAGLVVNLVTYIAKEAWEKLTEEPSHPPRPSVEIRVENDHKGNINIDLPENGNLKVHIGGKYEGDINVRKQSMEKEDEPKPDKSSTDAEPSNENELEADTSTTTEAEDEATDIEPADQATTEILARRDEVLRHFTPLFDIVQGEQFSTLLQSMANAGSFDQRMSVLNGYGMSGARVSPSPGFLTMRSGNAGFTFDNQPPLTEPPPLSLIEPPV